MSTSIKLSLHTALDCRYTHYTVVYTLGFGERTLWDDLKGLDPRQTSLFARLIWCDVIHLMSIHRARAAVRSVSAGEFECLLVCELQGVSI